MTEFVENAEKAGTTENVGFPSDFRTVSMVNGGTKLRILDQTRLPNELVWLDLVEIEEVWNSIRTLAVRGAPAIGVAAAGGLAVAAGRIKARGFAEFYQQFCRMKGYLATARPTAVNLGWALARMKRVVLDNKEREVLTIKAALIAEANAICEEDIACCRAIGDNGLPLLENCRTVLTHCNAGRLAAVQYGTALAPIYLAQEKGHSLKVFADETRPLLQGARLTAWELAQAGIDVTLICDNMAATVMAQGLVDAVIVGADRIAANGDVANKIGTSGVAVLARHFEIPFYVAAPCSTIDRACENGSEIVIEQRDASEVTELWYEKRMAPEGISVFNPAFDVTPAELVSAIITDKGVLYPPYSAALRLK
jgi:methylthioribose-1-phosphate isomerase